MSNREIVTYPDDVLTKKAEKVESIEEVEDLIKEMKEILEEADGVGLAAPQIGVSKQVFVVKDGHDYYGFVNPEIVEKSDETITTKEGCLSLPGLWIDVERPSYVKVEALTEEGERMLFEAEGAGAVVFQHEIDHLFGTLFIDRLSTFQKMKALLKYKIK
ncbi:MAG: peptide deformylase [Patescibacteria group bacterium]